MKNQVHYVDSRKVAVIGCGFVGSTIAFALMQSELNKFQGYGGL